MQLTWQKYQALPAGRAESAASTAIGALLLAHGIRRDGWTRAGLSLAGIVFLKRGITGLCVAPAPAPGPNVSVPHRTGIRIEEAITINRPVGEVFRFWRDLGNIAEFMEHVESVRTTGDNDRVHWIAKGRDGKRIEWDAQIINEKENELIAWRSLDGSEVANAGSVHFKEAAGGRGTEVLLELLYTPRGGSLGAFAAKLFGEDPALQLHSDLKRLKARLEAGVVPGTEGQSAGSRTPAEHAHPKHDAVSKASEESFPASDAPAFTH